MPATAENPDWQRERDELNKKMVELRLELKAQRKDAGAAKGMKQDADDTAGVSENPGYSSDRDCGELHVGDDFPQREDLRNTAGGGGGTVGTVYIIGGNIQPPKFNKKRFGTGHTDSRTS